MTKPVSPDNETLCLDIARIAAKEAVSKLEKKHIKSFGLQYSMEQAIMNAEAVRDHLQHIQTKMGFKKTERGK